MNAAARPFDPPPSPTAPESRRRTGWELSLAGELSDKHTELLNQFVEVAPCSSGTLWIDSCGGSVYTGLAIASLIRLRGLRVTAVVLGECSSAALLPFAACDRRYVTPHSTLLFHPMRWQSEEDVQLEQATEWARHFTNLEAELDALLARLLGIDSQTLTAWSRPGRFLTGLEAAEAGIAQTVTLFDGPFLRQIANRPPTTGPATTHNKPASQQPGDNPAAS